MRKVTFHMDGRPFGSIETDNFFEAAVRTYYCLTIGPEFHVEWRSLTDADQRVFRDADKAKVEFETWPPFTSGRRDLVDIGRELGIWPDLADH